MSTRRNPKRQRRLVVLSSEDEGDSNGNRNFEQAGEEVEEGDSEESEYIGSKQTTRSGRMMSRGTKRKITPSRNGAATLPLKTSTAFTASSSTTTLPTRRSQKQTQLQLPSSPQQQRRSQTRSLQTTPGSSPEKKRGKTAHRQSAEPSKSLHSFFARATEEERWNRREKDSVGKSFTEEDLVEEIEDEDEDERMEDFIEDDSYEELFTRHVIGGGDAGRDMVQGYHATDSQLDRRKERSPKDGQQVAAAKPLRRSGKRFLLPESSTVGSSASIGIGAESGKTRELQSPDVSPTQGVRPWAEEYAPANLDELVVNKRKVADVQKWLVDVFTGRSKRVECHRYPFSAFSIAKRPRRVLVLRGPAGSGKTTTISLLSKVLGFDILEWKNPLGSEFSSEGYVSMGAQFEDFLGRSDKFGSLSLTGGGEEQKQQPFGEANSGSKMEENRRAILVEEFPSSLNQSSSGLRAFRLAIQSYLAMTVPSQSIGSRFTRNSTIPSPPLIIIVSEAMLGSGGISSDSFTVHRLLGPELSNHPGLNIIDFNKIAPTFMAKAIDLVLKKEARRSKRKRIPGPEVLKAFADMGDVRSAISALEFMCLRGDEHGGWSGTVASRLKKPGKGGIALTAMEKESLEMVTQREASLGIFHAVGKVVYNKREDPTISQGIDAKSPQPPSHLQHHARPKVSQVSIDDLINETGTDLQTFIAALHENYVLSCTGPSFGGIFDECISNLSDTDILGPGSRFRNVQTNRGGVGSARSSYQGYGSSIDMLRQDEISFQVAVRGLLFSLPSPVKRQAPPGVRQGDAHKMFYPTSMRLWRQTEELDGLLDLWMRRLTDPTTDISSDTTAIARPRPDGVESWKDRRWMPGSADHGHDDHDRETASAATRAMISRDEVLLERLPYLGLISRNRAEIRELEKLTQFHGVGGQIEEEAVDDNDLGGNAYDGGSAMEPWSAPADRDASSPQKRRPIGKLGQISSSKSFGPKLVAPVEGAVEKLVLSDDDIEDD
ncbi:hypothetical protein AJ79_03862 [Helicocarpus griseus UAMH5409]|uniref:Checkpoint protein RAD24-like helical bundle domain-containing protein n=1 Tax=Helicocarpus griseus UAMH5409 TaxID=1447875 RepID=A0A2B7XW24_9EURO|nr:hypothetical protein AJ79_03862 [Helicocarpus griseus UAMH5409]